MSWNSMACYCDGRLYKSLFSLSIDFEFSYKWIFEKLKKNHGAPTQYAGHTIVLESWLAEHPEYQFPEKQPAGGINTCKEANK